MKTQKVMKRRKLSRLQLKKAVRRFSCGVKSVEFNVST